MHFYLYDKKNGNFQITKCAGENFKTTKDCVFHRFENSLLLKRI